jgi:exodeoxyribonuclease-1
MATQTFYWHDYETFGLDPQRDRPAQFAGVRTDADFNIIAKPLVLYCQPAADMLPHPDACAITGITPQLVQEKGVCEAEFIRCIHEQLAQPNTCTLGYNNLRFDDEVTRNTLYRNFYDPYAREWQNGNSRWDLIDVVRAARALRPEGIQWVNSAEGNPSFRLDQLTIANGITHEAAHDALADVYATIELAKLIKRAQPKLFQFLLEHRVKSKVQDLLQLGNFKPVIHISGKYRAAKNCLAVVLPLCKHPTDNNGVIVYDLSIDPELMLSLSAAEIQKNIFTTTENLPAGTTRIPLKTVHINRCPVLAPIAVLKPDDAARLQIDLSNCLANISKITAKLGLTQKLNEVFSSTSQIPAETDPDLAIYSGGFFADADKATMTKIRLLSPEQLVNQPFTFTDKRLTEMLFRYRARNYPETLQPEEQQRWQTFCVQRLTGEQAGAGITFENYFARLHALKMNEQTNQATMQALESYALEKMRQLGISDFN